MTIQEYDKDGATGAADLNLGRLSQLIRSAVDIARPPRGESPAATRPGAGEQVVFDVDVDGSRYILIKTVSLERKVHALSPREREIVRMVALGHQNKVIAAVLNISSWTVCTHVRRIFSKLGVTSRAAMVAKAAEFGITIAPYCDGDWVALSRSAVSGPDAPAGTGVPGRSGGRTGAKKDVSPVR